MKVVVGLLVVALALCFWVGAWLEERGRYRDLKLCFAVAEDMMETTKKAAWKIRPGDGFPEYAASSALIEVQLKCGDSYHAGRLFSLKALAR
jgi:hypothetical protein